MSALDVILTGVYAAEILGFGAVVTWMLFHVHAIITADEEEN